ncbi:MAG: 3,4-dihydroxy-2-butanone-4-phosphate synthase [Bdellovibrionales bacterium]|nr:3,4-dihydroxy-2-butanone-4-phosphate synthase [Oligoflexia bacterium]
MTKRLQAAIEALKQGQMVILIDSEDRENEGDLVLAAEFATSEKINFFTRKACGLVCLSMEAAQVDRLNLAPMVTHNLSPRKTAFTVSIEAREGITTGISPADRAHTILVASHPDTEAIDIVSPGHIFPLRAARGGVIERAGHTEGSIELCKLAGLRPAAVICEIINDDGSMARRPDLERFSKEHGIPMCTIEELIAYQTKHSNWLVESKMAEYPNQYSNDVHSWKIKSFKNVYNAAEHVAIFTDNLIEGLSKDIPLVRMHSECLTGDALGSLRCDCGFQLELALQKIAADASGGALIYLKNQEGRGIGLWNKIQAYALQDQGADTVDANTMLGFAADSRQYQDAAKMLQSLGLTKIRLLTNNPKKVEELRAFGIDVVERVALETPVLPQNQKYLLTKRERFQHQLENL